MNGNQVRFPLTIYMREWLLYIDDIYVWIGCAAWYHLIMARWRGLGWALTIERHLVSEWVEDDPHGRRGPGLSVDSQGVPYRWGEIVRLWQGGLELSVNSRGVPYQLMSTVCDRWLLDLYIFLLCTNFGIEIVAWRACCMMFEPLDSVLVAPSLSLSYDNLHSLWLIFLTDPAIVRSTRLRSCGPVVHLLVAR